MATWDDVRRIALALPDATESERKHGLRSCSCSRRSASTSSKSVIVEAWLARAPKRLAKEFAEKNALG